MRCDAMRCVTRDGHSATSRDDAARERTDELELESTIGARERASIERSVRLISIDFVRFARNSFR